MIWSWPSFWIGWILGIIFIIVMKFMAIFADPDHH